MLAASVLFVVRLSFAPALVAVVASGRQIVEFVSVDAFAVLWQGKNT